MKRKQQSAPPSVRPREAHAEEPPPGTELLGSLLMAQRTRAKVPGATAGLVMGELAALAEGGQVPLVTFPGQPGTAALPARTVVDLVAEHIGAGVALMFEADDSGSAGDRRAAAQRARRRADPCSGRPGGGRGRRPATDRQREGAGGPPMRQGQHHADARGEGPHPVPRRMNRLLAARASTWVTRGKCCRSPLIPQLAESVMQAGLRGSLPPPGGAETRSRPALAATSGRASAPRVQARSPFPLAAPNRRCCLRGWRRFPATIARGWADRRSW